MQAEFPEGFVHVSAALNDIEQTRLLEILRDLVQQAPLFQPVMPRSGKSLSVQMTNLGSLGWVADKSGYRYQPHHPVTGEPWPPIPDMVMEIWNRFADYGHEPQACLVNHYTSTARMGLHRDDDEEDRQAPVVSVSLGADALFRIGGPARKGPTRSIRLRSGDVVVLAGAARECFHGVDRLYPGTSQLVRDDGRINLTLRRVTVPES